MKHIKLFIFVFLSFTLLSLSGKAKEKTLIAGEFFKLTLITADSSRKDSNSIPVVPIKNSRDSIKVPVDPIKYPRDSSKVPVDSIKYPRDSIKVPVDSIQNPRDSIKIPVDPKYPQDSSMYDSTVYYRDSIYFIPTRTIYYTYPDNTWLLGSYYLKGTVYYGDRRNARSEEVEYVNDLKVNLYNSHAQLLATTYTDSDGKYEITGLESGDYVVEFSYGGNKYSKSFNSTSTLPLDFNVAQVTLATDLTSTLAKNITTYPNPAIDYVNISLQLGDNSEAEVKVVNTAGRVLIVESLKGTLHRLNTSGLDSGVYILEIKMGNTVKRTTFLKVD